MKKQGWIIFRNDFHQTWARARVPESCKISPAVMRRVEREICGHEDCTCGGYMRGGKVAGSPERTEWQIECQGNDGSVYVVRI